MHAWYLGGIDHRPFLHLFEMSDSALATLESGRSNAESRSGSTSTWISRSRIPVGLASPTPGVRSMRSSSSRATARRTRSGTSPRTVTAIMGGRTAASRTTGDSAPAGRAAAARFTSLVISSTFRPTSSTVGSSSTQMKLMPSLEVLDMMSTSSMLLSSSSIGAVTSCSISSADAPGMRVTTLAAPIGTIG